jgi:hypothetical protein
MQFTPLPRYSNLCFAQSGSALPPSGGLNSGNRDKGDHCCANGPCCDSWVLKAA